MTKTKKKPRKRWGFDDDAANADWTKRTGDTMADLLDGPETASTKFFDGVTTKFNPNHDAKGRFASGGGSGKAKPPPAPAGGIRGDYTPAAGDTHDIPEMPSEYGKRFGFTIKVQKIENGVAHVTPGHSEFGTKMPQESVKHFVNDLSGVVDVPPNSGNKHIDAVASGKAAYLGKGNDGVVFEHDGKVVKVSTTVPFQPFNQGHRSPGEAIEMMRDQFNVAKEMHQAGVPGIMHQSLRSHGDKAFVIRDKVEIPKRFTAEQMTEIKGMITEMHAKGYTLNDQIQIGIHNGKPVHFDTGSAKKSDSKWEQDSDLDNLRFFEGQRGPEITDKFFDGVSTKSLNQPRVPAGSPAGGQFTSAKHSAADVMTKIKASPQFSARQGEDHAEHWDKYAERWGVAGQEFHSVQIDTDTLLKMADTGSLGISRHRSEEEITKKRAGNSPINPTIISRPPNERAPVFVLDGTHSMIAQVQNNQTASRKDRDKYSKTHVIISTEAAAIMGIPIPDEAKK